MIMRRPRKFVLATTALAVPVAMAYALSPSSPSQPPVLQDPSQSSLHPAGAEFYWEIPSFNGTLDAYAEAPIVKLVMDAEVQAAVEALLADGPMSLGQVMGPARDALGLPPDASVPEAVVGLMRSLDGASMSLAGWRAPAARAFATGSKISEASDELMNLGMAIWNMDTPPTSLADFTDFSEAEKTDPWGRPYEFIPGSDTSEPEIWCRGRDGEVGGEGVDADMTLWDFGREAKAALSTGVFREASVALNLEFADEGLAAGLFQQALGMLSGAPVTALEPQTLTVQGVTANLHPFTGLAVEGEDPIGFWLAQAGSRIMLGSGGTNPQTLIAGHGDSSLANSNAYRTAFAKLPTSGGSTVIQGFSSVSIGELVSGLTLEKGAAEFFGITSLETPGEPAAFRNSLDKGRFTTQLFLPAAQVSEAGVGGMLGAGGVAASLWPFVQNDAIGVLASSIDPAGALDFFMEKAMQGRNGDQIEGYLKSIEEQYGFSLQGDLLSQIGPGVTGAMAPVNTLVALPKINLAFELEDVDRFKKGLAGFLAWVADESGGQVTVDQKSYRGTEYTVVTPQIPEIPDMASGLVPSPSFVILHDRLVVTLNSSQAKKLVRAYSKELPTPEHPFIATAGSEPAMLHGYMDWPSLWGGIYGGAKGLIGLMGVAGGNQLPFDPSALPEGEIFTRHFAPSTYIVKRLEGGGVLASIESSFGLEVPLAVIGAGLGGSLVANRDMGGFEPEQASMDTDVAYSEMFTIESAVQHYKLNNGGNAPENLEVLVTPDANGFQYLDEKGVPTDPWFNEYQYKLLEGGGYRISSFGEDGVESFDDLVVEG